MALTALYTAGLVSDTTQRPLDVIQDLAIAMGGQVAFVANELRMIAAASVAPVLVLGDDDFAGGSISVQVRQPRENTFNIVTGTIIDQDQNWTPDVDFPRVDATEFVTADGEELPLNVVFNAVNRSTQAQQLAAVMLRYARQALTLVATFKLTAYTVELFDTIAVTSSRYGWDEKAFVVMSRKWSLQGLIELTLRETDPTIAAFGDVFDATDTAPNTNLPLPGQVQQLTGLAVSSGTAELTDGSIVTRVKVTWTMATDQSVLQNGKVEIQWIPAVDLFPVGDWPGTTEQGGATQTTVVGLQGGLAYFFRARFIGLGGRVRGAWCPQVLAVVAAPPLLGGGNLFINGSFEADTSGLATNWTPYANGATGTVTNSDATGIFGSRAQRLDATGLGTGTGDRAGYQQGVNLPANGGGAMTSSIYAFGTAGAVLRITADWYDASGGTLLSTDNSATALAATVQRFSLTTNAPSAAGFGLFSFWIEQRPAITGAAFLVIDAAQLEQGSTATAFSESADEALAVAESALSAANAAATDATNAIAGLTAIASDNLLSSNEKQEAVQDYNVIIAEQGGIDTQATSFGITTEKVAYDGAITALTAYLATLIGWNVIPGSPVVIIGTIWRSNWTAVYTTRQTLLNQIATQAAERAAWALVTGVGKPADNASADLVLLTRGTCVATGNSVSKNSGAAAWDSDAYSQNGFIGGCFAAGQHANVTDASCMFGLNSDPTTDESFISIDYAWQIGTTGCAIWESGTEVAGVFTCAIGDVFAVVYDGTRVVYMQNNTQRREVPAPANLNLFFDSSFFSPFGARLDQIRFGPMSAVTDIGTVQLQVAAATDVSVATVASDTNTTLTTSMFSSGAIILQSIDIGYVNPDAVNAIDIEITCQAGLVLVQDPTVTTAGIGWTLGVETSPDNATWVGGVNTRQEFGTAYAAGVTSAEQDPVLVMTATLAAGATIFARLRNQFVNQLGGVGQFPSATFTVRAKSFVRVTAIKR